MHKKIRSAVFVVFFTIFIIGAPTIVLYTAGYRINLGTWKIQQTGVIAITTIPRGATVTINTVFAKTKTPYVAQRLTPGDYDVLLEKQGYLPWKQHVNVDSGSTTYITALLFADAKPELLLEDDAISVVGDSNGRYIYLLVDSVTDSQHTQDVWRYDTLTRIQKKLAENVGNIASEIQLSTDEQTVLVRSPLSNPEITIGINANSGDTLSETDLAIAINPLPEYSFFDNGSNIELRKIDTNALIALLPQSIYTTVFRKNNVALFTDSRNRAYLFNLTNHTVAQIDLPTALLATSTPSSLLAASDANEIDIYNPQSGERDFITRQSDPIIALAWHSSERALLFATASKIVAIERNKEETHQTTTLVNDASIVNMWPDANGKSLTFFGTVNGITGIWKVALTQ